MRAHWTLVENIKTTDKALNIVTTQPSAGNTLIFYGNEQINAFAAFQGKQHEVIKHNDNTTWTHIEKL